MLSDELKSINHALGMNLGKMHPDAAAMIRVCRRNLEAAIEQAMEWESRTVVENGILRLAYHGHIISENSRRDS